MTREADIVFQELCRSGEDSPHVATNLDCTVEYGEIDVQLCDIHKMDWNEKCFTTWCNK